MRRISPVVLFAVVGWSLAAAADDGPGEGWTLRFSDDFERAELGTDWQVVGGAWEIRDGMLRGDRAATIVCTWRLSGSLRLEFDAVATGDELSDLSAILDTSPAGVQDGRLRILAQRNSTGELRVYTLTFRDGERGP